MHPVTSTSVQHVNAALERRQDEAWLALFCLMAGVVSAYFFSKALEEVAAVVDGGGTVEKVKCGSNMSVAIIFGFITAWGVNKAYNRGTGQANDSSYLSEGAAKNGENSSGD